MKGTKTMSVYIAEDSDVVRERLIALLSEIEGIEIAGQSSDAPGAVNAIRKLKPDVVILDIQMPGGNGIDVLRQIKTDAMPPVVIMFSNHPHLEEKCFNTGADFFFDKSTEHNELIDTVKSVTTNFTRPGHNATI